MRLGIGRTALVIALMTALVGCGITGPANVPGLRRIVGTDLIGAKGATAEDQRKIDRTVVGLCGGDVWNRDECARHGKGR
ncbi:hypothetical protein [Agrobacterium tumefaciens]|uniref:Lipoprotein n=1 Tax=Agrobacterium tumefaciens TaxID=358 RepID=A0A4D7YNU3_AGRTU|nr:hypothetical protein [Agrobacterium tumefaciens]QCL97507.1 hypothetical protein CFBP7129_17485 [Agrobacterium tumefaciens]